MVKLRPGVQVINKGGVHYVVEQGALLYFKAIRQQAAEAV